MLLLLLLEERRMGKSAKSKSFLIYDIVRAITIFVLPLSEDELDLLGYGILASSRDFNPWEEGKCLFMS